MVGHKVVSELADFLDLDESDMLLGYIDGYEGQPSPGPDHSRSFYHGWRNGRVDAGRATADAAQLALAAELRLTSMTDFRRTAA